MPFTTREESEVSAKSPRATSLSSAQIRRDWSQKIRDEAVSGARITHKAYLDALKKRLVEVVGGTLSPQEAERRLRETLRDLGYTPEGGFGDGKVPSARPMTIQDLSSSRRIQLIIDTNVKRARSMGQVAASQSPLSLLSTPAWELTRTGARKKPRGNWNKRWAAAGAACGWKGASRKRMVALKSSPIWDKLGDGSGGFNDTLGSPFPPFAFGSGMAWVGVPRREWQKICAAEGIPDGMEEIKEAARASRETGVVEISAPVPPKVAREVGVGNPLIAKPEAPRPAPATTYTPPFSADFDQRDEANNAVDDALDAIDAAADVVADAVQTAEDALKADGVADDARGRISSALERARSLRVEVASLRGRVINYGSSVETTPAPTDAQSQLSYDETMRRYAKAAARTASEAGRRAEDARRIVAEAVAAGGS